VLIHPRAATRAGVSVGTTCLSIEATEGESPRGPTSLAALERELARLRARIGALTAEETGEVGRARRQPRVAQRRLAARLVQIASHTGLYASLAGG
jgi:hypothetical protein